LLRAISIEPGAVDSELKLGSGDEASRKNLIEFYKTIIPADSVARAIAYAIEQAADVGINDDRAAPADAGVLSCRKQKEWPIRGCPFAFTEAQTGHLCLA
jgi:hypothetical protein